jgi:hypothetical protein
MCRKGISPCISKRRAQEFDLGVLANVKARVVAETKLKRRFCAIYFKKLH